MRFSYIRRKYVYRSWGVEVGGWWWLTENPAWNLQIFSLTVHFSRVESTPSTFRKKVTVVVVVVPNEYYPAPVLRLHFIRTRL